jgi:UDP-N-acetylglucosamine 2-epimerase (non-hydrolysing)
MSDLLFQELDLPDPEYNLEVGSGSHGRQTAAMLERTEEILVRDRPDAVMVYGDTNSTIAGALAAAKLDISVAHVEAGLRSFNRRMPEEINRVVTDHISNVLFCPTATAVKNLRDEGITQGVSLVGDVMLDAVMTYRQIANRRCDILQRLGLKRREFLLLTIHRAGNTDSPERISDVIESVLGIPQPVVFPMHPRTRACLDREPTLQKLRDRLLGSATLKVIEPLSYLDMIVIEDNARIILTDSGGVQKEAYFLGVPCLTLREETEWVETLEDGWNRLVEPRTSEVKMAIDSLWGTNGKRPHGVPNLESFGQGRAASKIVKILTGQMVTAGNFA